MSTNNNSPYSSSSKNYEAQEINRAITFCKLRLADQDHDTAESKALIFYLEQLQTLHPCADEDKGRRYGKSIGGYGDSEIIKPYVLRNPKNNQPILNHDGSVKTINCYFRNISLYCHTIISQKASKLNPIDGIRAVSEVDQMRYKVPDLYTLTSNNHSYWK